MTSEVQTISNVPSLQASTSGASPVELSSEKKASIGHVGNQHITTSTAQSHDKTSLSLLTSAHVSSSLHILTPASSTVTMTSATLLNQADGPAVNNFIPSTINCRAEITSVSNDSRQPYIRQTRPEEGYHPSFVLQPSAQTFTQLLNAPHDQITDYTWNQPQGNITDDTMDKSSSHSLDQPTDEPSMSQSANHVTSDARLTLTPDQLSSKPASVKHTDGGEKYDVHKKRTASKPSTETSVNTELHVAAMPITKDDLDQFKKQIRDEMADALNQRPPANASDADEVQEKTTLRREVEGLRRENEALRQENTRLKIENNTLKTDTNKRLRETTKDKKKLRRKLVKLRKLFADDDDDDDNVDEYSDADFYDVDVGDDHNSSVKNTRNQSFVTSKKHKKPLASSRKVKQVQRVLCIIYVTSKFLHIIVIKVYAWMSP